MSSNNIESIYTNIIICQSGPSPEIETHGLKDLLQPLYQHFHIEEAGEV